MTIDDHEELIDLYILNIQKHDVYLGYEWLGFHNQLSIGMQDLLN